MNLNIAFCKLLMNSICKYINILQYAIDFVRDAFDFLVLLNQKNKYYERKNEFFKAQFD